MMVLGGTPHSGGNSNGNKMNMSRANCEASHRLSNTSLLEQQCHRNHNQEEHHHPTHLHHHHHHEQQHHHSNSNGKVETGVMNGEQGNSPGDGVGSGGGEEAQQKTRRRGFCDAIEDQLEHLGKGSTWLAIFLGQVLSGIMCVSAVTTVYLTDFYNVHIPNAQNFAFYILLATVFTTILACRPADRNLFPILRTRGWKYALVALLDAEANFLVTKSYQLTTLTSVQLLDCFTIPIVLSFSWLVLRIRYKVPHILGVSICLLGICCLVWADIEEGRPLAPGKDRFLGDMLCLCGAFLFGISNIAQEFVVKTFDTVEFLGMIGLFGSFVSGVQTVILEYSQVTSMDWSGGVSKPTVSLLIGFASAQLLFYVISASAIKLSSATAFNLSVLTADFYSLIVGIYLFHFKFHALYFLSFVLVMTGVMVFAIKPTEIDSHVYRSLTREHTTTLDLELMASSNTSSSLASHQHHQQQQQQQHHHHHSLEKRNHHNHNQCLDEVCLGGPGSLLSVSESTCGVSSGGGGGGSGGGGGGNSMSSGRSPMLSNQSCDVVLQTTAGGGCGGNNGSGTLRRMIGNKENKGLEGNNGGGIGGGVTYVIPEDVAC